MSNKKEEDSSNFSSTKTNSSTINKDNTSKNEEDDIFYKARIRGGIKHKSNNYQPGRATISVPLTSFSGISHNASFQSKLLFFNGGKPRPKFQHIPYPNERVPEDNKKKTINKNDIKKNEKKVEKKIEKKIEKKNIKQEKIVQEKVEDDMDDIDCNININNILESKKKENDYNDNKINFNYNNNKTNNNKIKKEINTKKEDIQEGDDTPNLGLQKNNTIYVPSTQVLSLNYKIPGFSKIQKEDKIKKKKVTSNMINIKLKSFEEQWSFQKILLDYNILDFTSKF